MITIEASTQNGFFKVNGIDYHKNHYTIDYDNLNAIESERNFSLCNIYNKKKIISSRGYSEINGVNSWSELISLLNEVGALNNNDVSISDQTTYPVIANFNKVVTYSTSTIFAAINTNQITVSNITGFVVGQYLQLFSMSNNKFYLGNIIEINSNTIVLDTPLDNDFDIGTYVIGANKNLNVNGSVTTEIYSLRNATLGLGVLDIDFDITRLIFICETTSSVDLSKFGDMIGGIQKGVVLRRIDGENRNIFNVKTNGDLANIMYDFAVQQATNPAQGQNGFLGRLTFSGQEKMGVALRIKPGEDLQIIIQDDLSTLIKFYIIAEGHEVIY